VPVDSVLHLKTRANLKLVAAVDRDEIDALEDLKSTNQIITSSLQNDLVLLQSKFKNITTDHEQQKSHLVDALLAKDKLRQELATLKEGKDSAGDENNTALQALKEVSSEIDYAAEAFPPPQHLSPHLSFDVSFYLGSPRAPIDEPTMLARERCAIGVMSISKMDNDSIATHIPLPMSPLNPRPPRRQKFRAQKWTDDEWEDPTTLADHNHSKRRNKKKSSKTSKVASRLPKRAERMRRRYCLGFLWWRKARYSQYPLPL
jgi:hypothetical protein